MSYTITKVYECSKVSLRSEIKLQKTKMTVHLAIYYFPSKGRQ